MKEAATMLQGEAGRTASILHQTPGWRWRRELCLTEDRSSARVGPPPRPGNACRRGNVGRMRGIVRARAKSTARAAWRKGWRVRQARAGCTARKRSTREWTALFQRTWKTTKLQRQETCGQHWGRADGSVRASAGGTARQQHLDECG